MEYSEIIEEMQVSIFRIQKQLELLKSFDDEMAKNVYLTRQKAADFIGKSIRQLDRDCEKFGIPKVYRFGGVRINKSELMFGMGLIPDPYPNLSEGDRILKRHGF